MSKRRTRTSQQENPSCLTEALNVTDVLDDIYNSPNPEIKEFLSVTFSEEMEHAQQRTLHRVAAKFRHLLSPQMQRVVDMRQLPVSQVALG